MTSFWVLVCFGVIGLPHTAVRCISYKDSKAVHRGIIIGTIVVAILMFGMHWRARWAARLSLTLPYRIWSFRP